MSSAVNQSMNSNVIVPRSLFGSSIALAEEETEESLGNINDGNDVPDDGISDVGSSGDNVTGEKLLGWAVDFLLSGTNSTTRGDLLGRFVRDLSGRLLGFLTWDSFVGYLVGSSVSVSISETDGLVNGGSVGWLLGRAVRFSVGATDGVTYGRNVGYLLGRAVSFSVGSIDGVTDGRSVGWSLGRPIGATDGFVNGRFVG